MQAKAVVDRNVPSREVYNEKIEDEPPKVSTVHPITQHGKM